MGLQFTMMKRVAVVLAAAWLAIGIGLTASDELTRAKELYRAASYDEALTLLNSLPASVSPAEAIEVHEFRVFCFIALDRRDDARNAMAALVKVAPQYQMSDEMASPRVRAMFTDVRRSLLPSIVQGAYGNAKAAFDRKDPDAVKQFDRVLLLLKDPDVVNAPGMADLVTVATGFRDLSTALARPAPEPVPTPAAPRTPPPVAKATIVPPVAISQVFPPFQIREAREWDGEVEVIIDDKGQVTSARMTKPIHPVYDAQLLRAARNWTYRPALKDGVPTQMLKLVTIHLDSRPACAAGRTNPGCRPAGN